MTKQEEITKHLCEGLRLHNKALSEEGEIAIRIYMSHGGWRFGQHSSQEQWRIDCCPYCGLRLELMTKQEEIREGMDCVLVDMVLRKHWNLKYPEGRMAVIGALLEEEKKLGVVRKVDRNGLMVAFHKFNDVGHNEESHGVDTKLCPRCQLLKFMIAIDSEGMVAVEELIGEEK